MEQHKYGVFGQNYLVTPIIEELQSPTDCVSAVAYSSSITVMAVHIDSVVLLSQLEFAAAVRQALRDFGRPEALRQNPLLNSHIVIKRTGGNALSNDVDNSVKAAPIATLQLLLQEAVESLESSPREAKFYRALYHAYLQPARSQEQAAEILDISIGSFRRHLKAGIAMVTDILWRQESEQMQFS